MFESSGDQLRMQVRYPLLFRLVALVFTPLGALLLVLVVVDVVGATHRRVEWNGVVASVFALVFGLLYLALWRDTKLVLDRAARTIAYDARRKLGRNESVRASFVDAARLEVSGTINWA